MRAPYLLLIGLVAACSSVGEDDICDCPAIDGGRPFTPDAGFGDGGAADTGTPFNGGGDFLCSGCVCDGTLRFCEMSSGGQAPVVDAGDDDADAGSDDASDADDAGDVDDADAGPPACESEAAASACMAIPLACLPKPTCECIVAHVAPECSCAVDPSGNGLVVTCVFP
jgi:hypothetical protein